MASEKAQIEFILAAEPIITKDKTDDEIEESLSIIISQQDLSYELIHPLNYDYFEACRTKLSWGNPLVNIHD